MKSLGDWLFQYSLDRSLFVTRMFESEEEFLDFYVDLYIACKSVNESIHVTVTRSLIDPFHVIFRIWQT
ncbi:hypothetical protein [Curionopolis virus]|uniref:PAG1 protein n=2 Tax=Curionopolis virus TaxID=490110 RepID=A0A068J3V5_9RHAB|nr:hypothetical protein [Curionopolis virus]AIE12115.1 pAG1 protein [Curionopolis virus]AJR28372.1 hypothetical protein [Curionopolis virus]